MSAPNSSAPRRGLVLPLVLMAMAVAIILGMCFLTSASTATTLSTAADHRLRARMIAESGLAMTLAYIDGDHSWRTGRTNGVWVTSQPLDGGTFTVFGEDGEQLDASGAVVGDGNLADDPSDPVMLTCVGVYQGARHIVRAVRHPPSAAGISVNERVEIKKTALVDSYNPEAGPYAPETAAAKAIARSNGTARKPYIKLRNSATVNGNVYYGPGGAYAKAVQKDSSATVNGTLDALPTAIGSPAISEPAWPAEGTSGNQSYSSGITTLTSDLWCDKLDLRGTATLRALGDVTLYVCDALTVTDDARIEVGAPMAYGAAVKGNITLNTSVPLDSYDSSIAGYGGTNIGSDALLATNSTAAGAITVLSTVKGDLYAGEGSAPATSILGTGTVTGIRGALKKPMTFPSPAALPRDIRTNPNDGDDTFRIRDRTYILDRDVATPGGLEVSGSGIFRVSGHRRVVINGDFTFNGSAIIDIPPDGSLKMYVTGKITMSGEGLKVNTGKSPARMQIIATGSGQSHLFEGRTDMYAIVDAPNSAITMRGYAQFYGAVIAGSLSILENAGLHNDRNPALVEANPRLPATWTTGCSLTVYTNRKLVIQKRAQVNTGPQDPKLLSICHLGYEPMAVKDNAIAYAEAFVPEMTMDISGDAEWTGRVRARDLIIGGDAIVTADDTGGTSNPGLIVEETVEVKDSAIVKGTGGTALIASHGATDTTIQIKDAAVYKGDGYTTPGGSPSDEIRVAATATYTGIKDVLSVVVPIDALTAPPVVGIPVDHVISGTTVSVITGDVYYKKLEVKDDAVLEIDGITRLILTDDFKFMKNARLVLRPGASLTVYCPKEVRIEESPQLNVGGHPGRLTLSCTTASNIELKKAAKLCATVLAPLAELKVKDTAEFFGAFSGRRMQIDQEGKVHCAQNQAGPITWIEQQ